MTDEEIYEKLNGVFHDVFDDDSIVVTAETSADDIEEWDSLAHVNLIVSVEHAFNVKFSMGEIIAMRNVGEMVADIKKKLPEE